MSVGISTTWIDEIQGHLEPDLARYLGAALPRYHDDFKIIQNLGMEGDLLEIGCYPYCMSAFLQRAGYRLTGLDKKPDRGSRVLAAEKLDIRSCDVETERFPFADASFDIILLNEVFEHLRIDPLFTLSEIKRCLRPGGRLMLTTPNLYGIMMVLRFLSGKGIEDPVEAFQMLKTTGHIGHLRTYSSANMRKFLEEAGFKINALSMRPLLTGSKRKRTMKKAIYTIFPRRLHDNIVVIASKNLF
jgi:SAM-dependent methyltransferase